MAKQPESRLQAKIRRQLEKTVGGWWFKVWGGPFTAAGIPDLIGCVEGYFFALEVKRPIRSSKPSAIQLKTIESIILKGEGVACVVRSPEEAIAVVRYTLGRKRRAVKIMAGAAGRIRVRKSPRSRRVILRATDWENIRHLSAAEKPSRRAR